MAWVYLDDQFPDHPKVLAAGPAAAWLFVAGLAYCKRHDTAGVIPKAAVPRLVDARSPQKLALRLCDVRLWEERGDDYVVHDYGDWNKTAESRSAAGRKAAQARWGRRDRNADADANASDSHSDAHSDRMPNADASGCTIPIPIPIENTPASSGNSEGAVDNPPQAAFVDQALELAATRYGRDRVLKGKGDNADGLARWWTQEHAAGARARALDLLVSYDLDVVQLADALLQPNPQWLRHHRRREVAS